MKKAIAKCSHEDAPELSLPPYRSAYRFTNTMFAKMMFQMKKNRNSYTPYSSNSHHGNSNMVKMSNMMNDNQDYSSSSYSNDNDAFDMFSEIFDSSDRMDNYRSSYDNKNQMGRMSHFKNMFNSMRFKRAAGDNLDL